MIKQNKGTLILTIVILLLPMVIGLIVWNRLPEQIPMHWNLSGEVDGWESKGTLVFFLPLFMVGIQSICALTMVFVPEMKGIKGGILQLTLWICPCVSLLIHALVYAKILGHNLAPEIIIPLVFGMIFMVIGNLLPKCKRNHFIGVKLPWTLNSDENWNKTHRFTGKVWVLGGVSIAATAFFGNLIPFLVMIVVMAIAPALYSYVYFRKHERKEA